VLVNKQRSRIPKAKKAAKTKKSTAFKKCTKSKSTTPQPPRVSDMVSSSVLDDAMKDMIQGSFLKN